MIRLKSESWPEADSHIDALFDQVDVVMLQDQIDRDVGMSDDIIGNRRREFMRAKRHRRGHPEQTAWYGLQIAGGVLGVFDFT